MKTRRLWTQPVPIRRVLMTSLLLIMPASQAVGLDLFRQLDVDGNGVVSAGEVTPQQRPYFLRALRVSDRNEDGQLTADELNAAVTDREPVRVDTSPGRLRLPPGFDIGSLDRNKDGLLTTDEIPAALQEAFQQRLKQTGAAGLPIEQIRQLLDARQNGSGERTRSESSDSAMTDEMKSEDMKKEAQPPTIRPGADNRTDRRRRQTTSDANEPQAFQRLDRNGNGILERSEVPQRLQAVFPRADQNNDGSLSTAEFEAVVRRMMQNNP